MEYRPGQRRCVHYGNLAHAGQCAAGVRYASVAGGEAGSLTAALPCFEAEAARAKPCPPCHYPTAAEHAAVEAGREEKFERARLAVVAVRKKHKKSERDVKGMIPCPSCGGPLQYQIGYAGGITAACSTKDCTEFRE